MEFLNRNDLSCDAALRVSSSTAPDLVASTLIWNEGRHSVYVRCDKNSGRSRIAYIGQDVFSTVANRLQLHIEAAVLQVVAEIERDIVL